MKKLFILYPTDFSKFSISTLASLLPFLKKSEHHLKIVHAASHKRKSINADKAEVRENLERFKKELPGLEKISYEFHWEFALSKDLILRESDKVETDLIIMPTNGAKGLNRLWGSKTEAVVRDAIVPVVVIPASADFKGLQKILLAADYDTLDCDCRLAPLLLLAEMEKSSIEAITVNRKEEDFSRKEKINRKMLKHRFRNIPYKFTHHQDTNVGSGLVSYAKEHKADIIAVMPRDYNFLETLFRESLSRKLVLDSPIPLLILK